MSDLKRRNTSSTISMATVITRRIVTDEVEVENAFEEWANTGEFAFTWRNQLFELGAESSNICERRNGKELWYEAHSSNGQFPDIEKMSNLVVVGDKVYAWCVHRLWFLDMVGFSWRVVEIHGGMPALLPLGATLRIVDEEDGDVIEHTKIYLEGMMYVVRFRLSGSEYLPQTTVPERHPLRSWEIDNALIETYQRLREEEEKRKRQEKEKEKKRQDEIRKLREDDEKSDVFVLVYSRQCELCLTQNPSQRAVFTSCGHFSCLVCAVEVSDDNGQCICPFCRKETGYVKAFEELQ